MFEEINERRRAVEENIRKSFGEDLDIEKARSGIYADNAENRRLGRVGERYGTKKEEEPAKKRMKKEEEPSSGSGRKKVDEYAKKTSTETLKKVVNNKNAPEELRASAIRELSGRNENSRNTEENSKSKTTPKKEKPKSKRTDLDKKRERLNSDIAENQSRFAADAYVKYLNGEDESMKFNDFYAEVLKYSKSESKAKSLMKKNLSTSLMRAGVAPESVDYYYKNFLSDLDTEAINLYLKKE